MAGKNSTETDEDILKNEYLKLVTTLKKPLTIIENRLLLQIQKKFSKKGFHLDINNSEITLYLQSIEFEAFSDYVQNLLDNPENNHDSTLVDKEIFFKIIEATLKHEIWG